VCCVTIRQALESALKVYKSGKEESFHGREIAQSNYKLGQVLLKLNLVGEVEQHLKTAAAIRRRLVPAEDSATSDRTVELEHGIGICCRT
jgi:hypothetical protein